MSSAASPLQRVDLGGAGPALYVKRDDLLHPCVSGNKWRKLVPQTEWLLRGGARGFASVGGVHSNHLAALAALGRERGFPTLGLVRAWDGALETPTLAFAKTCGMSARPASRTQLRHWRAGGQPGAAQLEGLHWLPEGGTTRLGLIGGKAMVREVERALDGPPEAYWVAVGSGGTAAGVARATTATVHAVACVRDGGLPRRVEALLGYRPANLTWHDGALGGFASGEPQVRQAMADFAAHAGIQLDPVYTAKVWLALRRWRGRRGGGGVHVLLHTGGLQGLAAWRARYG